MNIRDRYYSLLNYLKWRAPYFYGFAIGSHMSRYGIYPRTSETDPVWNTPAAVAAVAELQTVVCGLKQARN